MTVPEMFRQIGIETWFKVRRPRPQVAAGFEKGRDGDFVVVCLG